MNKQKNLLVLALLGFIAFALVLQELGAPTLTLLLQLLAAFQEILKEHLHQAEVVAAFTLLLTFMTNIAKRL